MIIPEQLYQKIIKVMPIPCVDLLITDPQRNVLLLKRRNEPAKGEWWFPGGRIHFGETRHVAAIRKLKEECGIVAETVAEIGTYDVILEVPGWKRLSHGITTLFSVQIHKHKKLSLDPQSVDWKWLKIFEWQEKTLHPFILAALKKI
jgi:colanic acid biosynthesis protein WcaH